MDLVYAEIDEGDLPPVSQNCIAWENVKAFFEEDSRKRTWPIWLLADSDAVSLECCAYITSSFVEARFPGAERFIHIPIKETDDFKRILCSSKVPIKIFLTRIKEGIKTNEWYIFFVFRNDIHGKSSLQKQKLRGKRISLAAAPDGISYAGEEQIMRAALLFVIDPKQVV